MQCIQMIPDEEGFLYPVVDTETCIHCGRCEQVCPVSAKREEKSFPQEAYVLQHRDEDVRHESTSGGAFSAIAEWIIGQGGVVFGAAFTDDFTVIHTAVVEKKDLWKFRNSKYVQTNYGTYPLKWFFSHKTVQADGDEISARRVMAALKELIRNEDKHAPLSDERLTQLLVQQGFHIARRTVAKYREQMGLPVARMRR